jgi:hypothetical protein
LPAPHKTKAEVGEFFIYERCDLAHSHLDHHSGEYSELTHLPKHAVPKVEKLCTLPEQLGEEGQSCLKIRSTKGSAGSDEYLQGACFGARCRRLGSRAR